MKYDSLDKIMFVGMIFFLLLVVGVGFGACTTHISDHHRDGVSVGTLINVRDEGAVWSRPSFKLLHSGEMAGEDFAVDSEALKTQADNLALTGARVKVKYFERYICWKWNYSSCKVAYEITPTAAEIK